MEEESRAAVKQQDMAARGFRFAPATHKQHPIKLNQKLIKPTTDQQAIIEQSIQQGAQVQRKLFSFLYIYAILIIGLYVTYAAYYYYQHHQQQQQVVNKKSFEQLAAEAEARSGERDPASEQLERRLESKIHLLERYIEVIAVDLQETKARLREREKCDCAQSCTFNGTRHADQSTWQQQCDTCTCQLGRISCSPRKCPPINCDDAVQPAGQCCPVCMKKCSYNGTLIRHGEQFKPLNSGKKECKCMDGLIKCEQSKARSSQMSASGKKLARLANNKPSNNSQPLDENEEEKKSNG